MTNFSGQNCHIWSKTGFNFAKPFFRYFNVFLNDRLKNIKNLLNTSMLSKINFLSKNLFRIFRHMKQLCQTQFPWLYPKRRSVFYQMSIRHGVATVVPSFGDLKFTSNRSFWYKQLSLLDSAKITILMVCSRNMTWLTKF